MGESLMHRWIGYKEWRFCTVWPTLQLVLCNMAGRGVGLVPTGWELYREQWAHGKWSVSLRVTLKHQERKIIDCSVIICASTYLLYEDGVLGCSASLAVKAYYPAKQQAWFLLIEWRMISYTKERNFMDAIMTVCECPAIDQALSTNVQLQVKQ